MRLIEQVWFNNHQAKWCLVPLLLPFGLVFWLLSSIRLLLFKLKIKSSVKLSCPVVVVGNIGVGGNGKTPVVVFLVEQLMKQGIKVGVISRGYGGQAPHYPYLIDDNSSAAEAGDEPILIYKRCQIPVVVGADRIAAGNKLISLGCQIIISDDGLQHYRLKRDYEFLVVDAKRLFGNGLLLPAGPLRETTQRLNSVKRIIFNGGGDKFSSINTPQHNMLLKADYVVNVLSGKKVRLAEFFLSDVKVNAIAGIGDPQRFFDYLTTLGFMLDKTQGFIDHQAYNAVDFSELDDHSTALLMTEKDAVKCYAFAKENWWFLPVEAAFDPIDNEQIMADIYQLIND